MPCARTRRVPGLLYAGAEHGIYVSFDNGGRWQSLSLNLPDTQVSDIVVEKHDLVISTNGRSMWVLPNIAPIRQMSDEVARTASLHLYAPEGGVRRARPVAIDYYLKSKADKVTIDILDASGRRRPIVHRTREEEVRRAREPVPAAGREGDRRRRAESLRVGPALRGRDRVPGADHVERRARAGTARRAGPLSGTRDRERTRPRRSRSRSRSTRA